jgi:ribosomal protein S27E
MNRATVELHQAYEWTCEKCGRQNFGSSITAELTPEERQEMLHDIGDVDDDDREYVLNGCFLTSPDEVTCAHCGETFDAIDSRGPNESEM